MYEGGWRWMLPTLLLCLLGYAVMATVTIGVGRLITEWVGPPGARRIRRPELR